MRVIGKKRLREFWTTRTETEALKRWRKIAAAARWNDPTDVRRTFPSADAVRLKSRKAATVFNVAKTGCRIIAEINYPFGMVYIRLVLSHDAYAKGAWKREL
jgi:mRNA interferase HigB